MGSPKPRALSYVIFSLLQENQFDSAEAKKMWTVGSLTACVKKLIKGFSGSTETRKKWDKFPTRLIPTPGYEQSTPDTERSSCIVGNGKQILSAFKEKDSRWKSVTYSIQWEFARLFVNFGVYFLNSGVSFSCCDQGWYLTIL